MAIIPQIKNIVFLMLENRSLDNLLGWLYKDDTPERFLSSNNSKEYDGLKENYYWLPDVNGAKFYVKAIDDFKWQSIKTNCTGVPGTDPYEQLRVTSANDFWPPRNSWSGVMNQFYGNQNPINGLPVTKNGHPAMQGFLQDFADSQDALLTYTPEQLTVINSLARNYAVSDRWFSSVPSDTAPNRAYSLCGSSFGRESNIGLSYDIYDHPTLFNGLQKRGKSWKLYYSEKWSNSECWTVLSFPQILQAGDPEKQICHIDDLHHGFFADAQAGTLPDFSYIEPKWGYETVAKVVGNEYHPPIFVGCGEYFLYQVYTHLQQGPQWKDTLLIVTFDEHGGTYDHVPPPGIAINPDGIDGQENGFKFDQFGARVPTLLISPYIPKGTVFRSADGDEHPYDHTSFIKTVLMWAGMTRDEPMNFGKRAQSAPTFEDVLSDQRMNLNPSVSPPAEGVTCNEANPRLMAGTEQLIDIPVGAAMYILKTSKTKEEIAAAAALYRKDPKKFEAEKLAPQR
jgi:phospholipase C